MNLTNSDQFPEANSVAFRIILGGNQPPLQAGRSFPEWG
jgi:hypothetical protein